MWLCVFQNPKKPEATRCEALREEVLHSHLSVNPGFANSNKKPTEEKINPLFHHSTFFMQVLISIFVLTNNSFTRFLLWRCSEPSHVPKKKKNVVGGGLASLNLICLKQTLMAEPWVNMSCELAANGGETHGKYYEIAQLHLQFAKFSMNKHTFCNSWRSTKNYRIFWIDIFTLLSDLHFETGQIQKLPVDPCNWWIRGRWQYTFLLVWLQKSPRISGT